MIYIKISEAQAGAIKTKGVAKVMLDDLTTKYIALKDSDEIQLTPITKKGAHS